jgi:hypothetical protein
MRSKARLLGPELHSFVKILSVTSRQGVRRRLMRFNRRRLVLPRPIRQVARRYLASCTPRPSSPRPSRLIWLARRWQASLRPTSNQTGGSEIWPDDSELFNTRFCLLHRCERKRQRTVIVGAIGRRSNPPAFQGAASAGQGTTLSCAAEIKPQQSYPLPRARAGLANERANDGFYVYKGAVTHSADNAMANPRDSAAAPGGP